jgi:type I restriction enzyme M protein
MANKDVLLDVLEKFTSPDINLTPFEELIRKFNEDNNEEAGEHFTPR